MILQSLCQSHSIFNKICHDNQFWIDRFQYDQLPLITKQNSKINWINEYKKVINAIEMVKRVVNEPDINLYGHVLSPCHDIALTDILALMIKYDFKLKHHNNSIASEYNIYQNANLTVIVINIEQNLYTFTYGYHGGITRYYIATREQVENFIFDLTYHYCIKYV